MVRRGVAVFAAMACGLSSCQTAPRGACQTSSEVPITDLVDRDSVGSAVPVVDDALSKALAAKVGRTVVSEKPPGRQFNVLVLSGGGSYGAYSAGVLAGWSETGQRPNFDVVTGISTGALVATLAFLGPERDADLRRFYTTVSDGDIFALRRPEALGLLGESVADSRPLDRLIAATVDDATLARVAAEHAKGRRLYVGTTHLDSKRLVVWDMGAIAARGGPIHLSLFRKVLLASASIPGFFPPVRLPVEVDGKGYEELHVDGGVTAALFYRPPEVSAEEAATLGEHPLAGSNVYIIVAGKLFPDAGCAERKFAKIAAATITALLSAQTRGDLFQLFALCLAGKMNYRMTAIPANAPTPADSTTFHPPELTALFEVGRQQGKDGSAWRSTPPGSVRGEQVPLRSGLQLTARPNGSGEPALTKAPAPTTGIVPVGGTKP